MSGMILAGASPFEAVRYQVIIEYVIIGSAALTSFCVATLAYRGFFHGASPAPPGSLLGRIPGKRDHVNTIPYRPGDGCLAVGCQLLLPSWPVS
jgi:hypothetical protein